MQQQVVAPVFGITSSPVGHHWRLMIMGGTTHVLVSLHPIGWLSPGVVACKTAFLVCWPMPNDSGDYCHSAEKLDRLSAFHIHDGSQGWKLLAISILPYVILNAAQWYCWLDILTLWPLGSHSKGICWLLPGGTLNEWKEWYSVPCALTFLLLICLLLPHRGAIRWSCLLPCFEIIQDPRPRNVWKCIMAP